MNKSDYDKYYQQGGSYVIPVEIFNELFEDYECFKNDCKKYKEVIDKLNNKINLLKTCEDKPKEDIIYPHWEICNETKQELLDILKGVNND